MTHQRNAVLGIAGLILMSLVLVAAPTHKPPPEPVLLEAPVPLQESTTADAGAMLARYVPGKLPEADSRQLKADGCKVALGQYVINGLCWQRLPVPPPCPLEDGAWEHDDHRCYVRVLRAERPRQSGEPRPRGVAEP